MRIHPHLAPVKTYLNVDGKLTENLEQVGLNAQVLYDVFIRMIFKFLSTRLISRFTAQINMHPILQSQRIESDTASNSLTYKASFNITILQLASEMTNWLQQMGVSCWNALELGMDYTELDESGVPYGIVISSQTLSDGILRVRHRDSSLKVR